MEEFMRENKYNKTDNSKSLLIGIRPLIEAFNSGITIDKIMIQRGLGGDLIDELMALIKDHRTGYQFVPLQKLNRVSRKNHQGVIAFISPIDFPSLNSVVMELFENGKNPRLLMLDGISDVRNFGAVARSAECFGFDAIIIPFRGAAQVNEDAVKTSAGALLKIKVCKANNLAYTVDFLKESGVHVVGISEKANHTISEIESDRPICIVMGSEDLGISSDVLKNCDSLARIPMTGTIESLNVSVSAGIAMYEFSKQ